MSEVFSNGVPSERQKEHTEAAPATTADAVGTERSDPERSDGSRSGVETASAACSPHAASPAEVRCPSAPPDEALEAIPVEAIPVIDDTDVVHAPILEADPAEAEPALAEDLGGGDAVQLPRLGGRHRGRRLIKKVDKPETLTPEQRLLLLDTWRRSGLPAGDFAAMVGLSKHTLYGWKKKFEEEGPAGLMDRPRGGPKGSRLHELTKRTILMLKQTNPDWGCQRISDMLLRGPALPASPGAVAQVLHEAGNAPAVSGPWILPSRPRPSTVSCLSYFPKSLPLWLHKSVKEIPPPSQRGQPAEREVVCRSHFLDRLQGWGNSATSTWSRAQNARRNRAMRMAMAGSQRRAA